MSIADSLSTNAAVALLSAAPSHTDESADFTLAQFGFDAATPEKLGKYGFLIRAGREWRISTSLRSAAMKRATESHDLLWKQAHEHYLSMAKVNGLREYPSYLLLGPGAAYHGTEVNLEEGLDGYRAIAVIDSLPLNLEAVSLADEQLERGTLTPDLIEIQFLRGMTLYRAGEHRRAIELLRPVSRSAAGSKEIAIAQHLVARADCNQSPRTQGVGARELFAKSIQFARKNHDLVHEAHVKHSMAQCIMKSSPADHDMAVVLLRQSLELVSDDDSWGRAMVAHSLAKALLNQPGSKQEVQDLLLESQKIGIALGRRRHVRLVKTTMRNLDSGASPSSNARA